MTPAVCDTNILVYALDGADPAKQATARQLLQSLVEANALIMPTQVLQELHVVLQKRLGYTRAQARAVATHFLGCELVETTAALLLRAMAMAERDGLQTYDAIIVQAAIDAGAQVLYTEDMQHGRVVEGAPDGGLRDGAPDGDQREGQPQSGLRIVNPFA
jgi:predicted nucleic acid-binding protein